MPETENLPPHDSEAEKSLIGSVLRENGSIHEAAREVSSGDFYSFAHQQLWKVFCKLSADGNPIDPVTVWDAIESIKRGQDIGGSGYIFDLWNAAPAITNAVHYAKIVRRHARLRAVISLSQTMQRDAAQKGADAEEIIAKAAEAVFEVAVSAGSETVDWKTAMDEAMQVLDRRSGKLKDGKNESGLQTGWDKLDKLTGGLHKAELVILAARPSVGKTLAALNIIDAVASEGARVFFASLEQGRTDLVHRVLAKRSGLNSHKFRTARFSEFDEASLWSAVDAVRGHNVWINDGAGQPLAQVVVEARRIKAKHGLDLVAVDYLGLMDGERDRRAGTRSEEIGRLTRGLKRLAKDLDIVVLCLAQLNRGSENRPDRRPRLWDLRDSGEIEQDADTVFMLHKPEEKDAERETDRLDWLIEKQRNGPCGEIKMIHHKRTFSITEDNTEGSP